MAVIRDRPFTQFNFLVDIGTGNTSGPDAGFEEVTGLESTVDVIEYRNGNSKENSVMKLTGLNKATDVIMRRGVIGSPRAVRVVQRDPQRQPERATAPSRSRSRTRTTPRS